MIQSWRFACFLHDVAIRHQLVIWKKLNSHVAPYVKSSVMCDWGSLHHAKCTMYRVFVPISLSPTTHSHRFCCERLFLKLHTQLIYIYIYTFIYIYITFKIPRCIWTYIQCIGSLELRWWKLHGYLKYPPLRFDVFPNLASLKGAILCISFYWAYFKVISFPTLRQLRSGMTGMTDW